MSSVLPLDRPAGGRAPSVSRCQEGSDAAQYRAALARFPTGVAVMTAVGLDGRPIGMTVNSFASVSLNPAIILWSISRTTPSYLAFACATCFAVNILAEDQQAISTQFARPSDDKFASVAWERGIGGVALIEGCAARMECSLRERHLAGDHDIILGNVERFTYSDRPPLAFALSGYRKLSGPLG